MRKLFFAMLCIVLIVVWNHYRPQPKKPITTKQVQSNHSVIYGCVDAIQPDSIITREQVIEAMNQFMGNYPAVYDTTNGISIRFYLKQEPDTTPHQLCGIRISN